jgi:twitching motility protein PilT
MDLNGLLKLVIQKGISDIHFKVGSPPAVRVNGKLTPIKFQKLDSYTMQELAYSFMSPAQKKMFEQNNELDLAYSIDEFSRFRVNINKQRGTIALTLRVVPLKVKTFAELHLPEKALKQLASENRGLILLAGVTGMGKTTTMNSMLDYINQNFNKKIVTIEDPIEYFHTDVKSFILQREIGSDTESYAKALKYVLRQDPDVIVIGEMRDFEAISSAITAAETGHLVLSTIHTMDAVNTIDRIINTYPQHQQSVVRGQVANVIKGIVAQRLVMHKNGNSMLPATEVLIGTSYIKKLIIDNKIDGIYKALEQGSFYNMHTFDTDIVRLYKEDLISKDEAMDKSTNPDDMVLKMQGMVSE